MFYRDKDVRNILETIQRKKVNRIDHILLRNCFLKHIIEGQIEETIEVTGRRGRRRKQLTDDLKDFEVRHPRCVSNKSNVMCTQYVVKHNLVLDGILIY